MIELDGAFVPRLADKARLVFDHHEQRWVLLYPERGLVLGDSAAAIARRCDGTRTVDALIEELASAHPDAPPGAIAADVRAFLAELRDKALLSRAPAPPRAMPEEAPRGAPRRADAPRPFTLIAELTYRCPLSCPYCSNPTDLAAHQAELTTDAWLRVLEEAADLGVLQVHFTGGEPLARKDLEALVARARALGLYTNLVTSGVPLARERLARLVAEGLDHVQVSVQSSDAELADAIAGYPGHARKLEVMRWVKELGLPLTMNVVMHRANLGEIDALVALAESAGADRLELANTQYVTWALANRDALLPTREQIAEGQAKASAHAQRLRGVMDVLFVKADYFGDRPKACMDGWGRRFLHMTPDGLVLPCHAATSIPGLAFERAGTRPLGEIWAESEGLRAFRGEAWMQEPCRSCDRRASDFGGCRCQAYALTGDARATDPACALSPRHALVDEAHARAAVAERRYLHRGR